MEFPEYTPKFIRALAEIGYHTLTRSPAMRDARLFPPSPPKRFDEREDDQVDVIDDPDYLLACRDFDRQLIEAAEKSLVRRQDKECFALCGIDVTWARKLAALKTWGGQQTLTDLVIDRMNCMRAWRGVKPKDRKAARKARTTEPTESPVGEAPELAAKQEKAPAPWKTVPATLYESAVEGVAGLMPGDAAVNPINLGFSPLGQKFVLRPWLEVLVIVGVQFAPITVLPAGKHDYGRFALYHHGHWHTWHKRARLEPYYFAWDVTDDRGLLPHQFARWIDPSFEPGPFDDLQIPKHLLDNTDLLWNEIERLRRIADRAKGVA